MVKRGLIISYYFPPTGGGGVQRWVKLITYLQPLGWDFTVISSTYNGENPKDETLLKEIPADTKIIRVPGASLKLNLKSKISFFKKSGYLQRWISAFLNVTDSRESWNKKAKSYIKKELNEADYDVVILSSPPYSLAILAADLTKELDIPVILDLRDPWTINPYKIHPTRIHHYMDQRREKEALNNLDYIISAYQSTLDDYALRIPGFKEKKQLLLPNGYDEEDFYNLRDINIPMEGDLNLGFSGSMYSHLNTPHRLFAAISALKKENINIYFHHIGSSVQDLKTLAKNFDISDNIKIWGYKNHKECLAILSLTDVLCLILDNQWPNSQYTIGGKFYEYLRLKKPILGIVPPEGEAAMAIRDTVSGVVVSDNQITTIVKALKQLLNSQIAFSWKGIDKFNRKVQAGQLSKFLGSVIPIIRD